MIYVLYILLGLLVILCVSLLLRQRKMSGNLKQMSLKIEEVLNNHSEESLHVFTDDRQLQEFLSAINQLLDLNRKNEAEKIQYQEAMRKMLSNVSHDLKTPLTVINGYIETLLVSSHIDEEERARLLQKVHAKSKDLIDLINQFFDLAKLESKDKVIHMSKVNMNEICRNVVLSHYVKIQESGLKMEVQIPEEDYYIIGNEEAIIRSLNNLIMNSIHYGYEGGVVGVHVFKDHAFIKTEVWDKGKGIEEKFYSDVFERLYTLEDSRNKNYQGSGLGLTITKRLIEQMNGQIKLISEPYKRTSFTMSFEELK